MTSPNTIIADMQEEIDALRKSNKNLIKSLDSVLRIATLNICSHDETHRGGFIWEICDQCGASWADDKGGKPEFAYPKEIEKAYSLIAKVKSRAKC